MEFNIGAIQKLTSPNPFALISTTKEDGSTNLMALSWWTYASNRPATVAVCLSKKGLSGGLIHENGEFGLNIVDETLAQAAFGCGTCSGRTANKAEQFGIELMEPDTIKTRLVSAHKVAMECRLVSEIEVADHIMYIAEVVSAHVKPEAKAVFAFEGYGRLASI